MSQVLCVLSPRKWWAAARFVACLLAAAPAAAGQAGQVSGLVNDATGAPLPGVTVTLSGASDRVTTTNQDGRFVLEQLPDGEYELTAGLDHFVPMVRTIRLVNGTTEPVVLTLSVGVFEQVLVTTAKTGERDVQSAPLALSALPGSELQLPQVHTVADLAGRVPAVTFSQNSDFSQLTIRGIGTNVVFAGSDPSSAVYVDGVYLARPVMVVDDFLDLERVEVLRGPQGTLYGRNAVGGALNVITKTPSNGAEASARFVGGSLDTLRAEARVSGPIVRDKVMGSGAILRGVREGFVRDLDHPDHPLGGEDVTAARGKLRVVFNDRSDLLISADVTNQDPTPLTYAKVLAVKPGFQVDNPADVHEVRTSTLAEGHNDQYGAAARLTIRLTPKTTLTSLTAFRKLDYQVINDADITELNLTSVDLHENQHQLSEELTVSQQSGRLAWLGGLFLFDEVDHQPTVIRLEGPGLLNFLDPKVEADSQAAYGQATLGVTRRLSVTGGLRYTREGKTIDNLGRISTFDLPTLFLPGAYAYSDEISHNAWAPKAGLEIQTGKQMLTYISATRGFKSGGFNFTSPEPGRGYAPEWAWSYEGGVKTTVANGRAWLNVAVFQTDYTNLQVQTAIRPGVIDISNAAAATIRGIEFEGTTELTRMVRFGGHLSWLDSAYDRYVAVGVAGVTGDVSGNRLNNAPLWSGRLWLEWSGNLGPARAVSLRADSRWQSTVFFTPFNDRIQYQPSYAIVDLTAEYSPSRRWGLGMYVRNLTNTDFITGTFSSPIPAIGGRPGEPRQIGIQFTVRR
jgi:iron complex outermembrane receptor protein